MKERKKIDQLHEKDVVDYYNSERTQKPASGAEVKRTLEALNKIKGHPLLLQKIKEEGGNKNECRDH